MTSSFNEIETTAALTYLCLQDETDSYLLAPQNSERERNKTFHYAQLKQYLKRRDYLPDDQISNTGPLEYILDCKG